MRNVFSARLRTFHAGPTGVFAGLKAACESVAIPLSVVVAAEVFLPTLGYRGIFVMLAVNIVLALMLLAWLVKVPPSRLASSKEATDASLAPAMSTRMSHRTTTQRPAEATMRRCLAEEFIDSRSIRWRSQVAGSRCSFGTRKADKSLHEDCRPLQRPSNFSPVSTSIMGNAQRGGRGSPGHSARRARRRTPRLDSAPGFRNSGYSGLSETKWRCATLGSLSTVPRLLAAESAHSESGQLMGRSSATACRGGYIRARAARPCPITVASLLRPAPAPAHRSFRRC